MSKLTFRPLTDMTSVAQGKQAVLRDGERIGYVFQRDGKWLAYVYRHPDKLGTDKSREKAFADAEAMLTEDGGVLCSSSSP